MGAERTGDLTTPFEYRNVSPYMQSTAGWWSVIVSHAGQADTIATTGDVAVGEGKSRTVMLADAPVGGISLQALDP